MFRLLGYQESLIIFRSIFILIIIVCLGVGAAEEQVNHLTQRQEHLIAFHVTYDSNGIYRIYNNGAAYQISAVYPLANIINNKRNIVVVTNGYQLVIPKYIELDCRQELTQLELYIKKIKENFNVYAKAFR